MFSASILSCNIKTIKDSRTNILHSSDLTHVKRIKSHRNKIQRNLYENFKIISVSGFLKEPETQKRNIEPIHKNRTMSLSLKSCVIQLPSCRTADAVFPLSCAVTSAAYQHHQHRKLSFCMS